MANEGVFTTQNNPFAQSVLQQNAPNPGGGNPNTAFNLPISTLAQNLGTGGLGLPRFQAPGSGGPETSTVFGVPSTPTSNQRGVLSPAQLPTAASFRERLRSLFGNSIPQGSPPVTFSQTGQQGQGGTGALTDAQRRGFRPLTEEERIRQGSGELGPPTFTQNPGLIGGGNKNPPAINLPPQPPNTFGELSPAQPLNPSNPLSFLPQFQAPASAPSVLNRFDPASGGTFVNNLQLPFIQSLLGGQGISPFFNAQTQPLFLPRPPATR